MVRTKYRLMMLLAIVLAAMASGCKDEAKSVDSTNIGSELVFYSIDPGPVLYPVLNKAKAKFEAGHKGTKVRFEYTSLNDYYKKLHSLVQSGQSPDVIVVGPAQFHTFERNKYLMDMQLLAKADGFSLESYFDRSLLNLGTIHSKLVAVMLNVSPMMVAYNKSWFEQAGIPYPNENWTWEEFAEIANTLQAKIAPDDPTRQAAIYPAGERFLSPMVISRGGSYVSPDGATLKNYLDSKETAAALEWYREQLVSKRFKTRADLNQIIPDMINGTVGMAVVNYDATLFIKPESRPKIGLTGLPRFKNGTRATTAVSNAIGIMETSKQPRRAWEFVKMLAIEDNEITREMLSLTLNISKPVVAAAADQTYVQVKEKELLHVKKDFYDLNMYWANVQAEFQQGIERLVLGEGDMREGLSRLAERIDTKLAEARNADDQS